MHSFKYNLHQRSQIDSKGLESNCKQASKLNINLNNLSLEISYHFLLQRAQSLKKEENLHKGEA